MMKRRVCSYDMLAVPDPSFVLKDAGGMVYPRLTGSGPSEGRTPQEGTIIRIPLYRSSIIAHKPFIINSLIPS